MTERALALLRRFGRDAVSFQGLESGFSYWFEGDDACVAYVDTGGAWVSAGGPWCAPDRRRAVASRFALAARIAGRRASFFAMEDTCGMPALQIGEQPVWDAAAWPETLAQTASLRYQIRRAPKKGVTVRRVSAAEIAADPGIAAAFAALSGAWQAAHRMPPMSFLVSLEPLAFAAERFIVVAEREGRLVGYASVAPVFARGRWFVEDFVRAPDAPNGTTELLVDAVLRAAPSHGIGEVTLGLAPLAGSVSGWLRALRWLGGPLYDFAGLRAFKAKLRPARWEPVHLCVAAGEGSTLFALGDSLRAFAGGSLVRFGVRTLVRS